MLVGRICRFRSRQKEVRCRPAVRFRGDARSGRVSPKGDSHIGPSGEGDAWQGSRAFERTLDGSPSASSSNWLAVRRYLLCGFPRYVWRPLIRGSVVVFRFSAPPFVTMLCISPPLPFVVVSRLSSRLSEEVPGNCPLWGCLFIWWGSLTTECRGSVRVALTHFWLACKGAACAALLSS